MIRRLLGFTQHSLARSGAAVDSARLLRNQAAAVIGRHLADGPDIHRNGEALLIRSTLAPGASWIDVGANRGEWSGVCAAHVGGQGKALMIEPDTRHQPSLLALAERITSARVVQAAAGATAGIGKLHQDRGVGELSSLVSDPRMADLPSIEVQITTVDDEAASFGMTNVHLLKTDCEGYDLQVLSGASRLLNSQAVEAVQFEYNSQWAYAGSTLSSALTMFAGFGYTVYLLKGTGLWHFSYERYGEFFSYANFVALSDDANRRLASLVRGQV